MQTKESPEHCCANCRCLRTNLLCGTDSLKYTPVLTDVSTIIAHNVTTTWVCPKTISFLTRSNAAPHSWRAQRTSLVRLAVCVGLYKFINDSDIARNQVRVFSRERPWKLSKAYLFAESWPLFTLCSRMTIILQWRTSRKFMTMSWSFQSRYQIMILAWEDFAYRSFF